MSFNGSAQSNRVTDGVNANEPESAAVVGLGPKPKPVHLAVADLRLLSVKKTIIADPSTHVAPPSSPNAGTSAESTDYCLTGLFRSPQPGTLSKETTRILDGHFGMAVIPYKPWLAGKPVQQIDCSTASKESDTSLFGDVGELPTTSAESTDLSTTTRFQQSTARTEEETVDDVKSLSLEPVSIERAWTDPIVRPKSAASGLRSLPNDVVLADHVKGLSSDTVDAICGSAESDVSEAGNTQTVSKERAWSDMRLRALHSEDLYAFITNASDGSTVRPLTTLSGIIACAEEIFADYRALLKELADEQSA
ncbi:hypothetical protein AAVH_07828 [Aphelenchoides avenae]|nr:hypothetical protein AAVH_07828 [Aphelenchus avenae]